MTLTTGPHDSASARHGFTLLELVLVMVIICTVLGMASVSLRGFFVSRKIDDTAVRIVSLARLARSAAVSEGRDYRLVFDREGRRFYLARREQGGFRRPRAALGRAFRLPEEVSLELITQSASRRDHLTFSPDGRAEPATVRLTDIKGGVLEVRCQAPTEHFVIADRENAQ
jgi:type II secretion system protein H